MKERLFMVAISIAIIMIIAYFITVIRDEKQEGKQILFTGALIIIAVAYSVMWLLK